MTTTIIKRFVRAVSVRWRTAAAVVLLAVGIGAAIPRSQTPVLTTFRTAGGWGYRIGDPDGKPRIYQPYIPVLEERIPFRTEKEAHAVGSLVLRRLKKGRRFTVTCEDLQRLGVFPGNVPGAGMAEIGADAGGAGKNS